MKRVTYQSAALLLAVLSLTTACTKSDNCSRASGTPAQTAAQTTPSTARIANGVTVSAMAPAYSDQRNCTRGYGDCAWCITDSKYSGLDNEMPVQLSFASNTTMKIEYQRALQPLDDATIDLPADVVLPQAICEKLQVRSALIKAGSYTLNMNYGSYGALFVNVTYVD